MGDVLCFVYRLLAACLPVWLRTVLLQAVFFVWLYSWCRHPAEPHRQPTWANIRGLLERGCDSRCREVKRRAAFCSCACRMLLMNNVWYESLPAPFSHQVSYVRVWDNRNHLTATDRRRWDSHFVTCHTRWTVTWNALTCSHDSWNNGWLHFHWTNTVHVNMF